MLAGWGRYPLIETSGIYYRGADSGAFPELLDVYHGSAFALTTSPARNRCLAWAALPMPTMP